MSLRIYLTFVLVATSLFADMDFAGSRYRLVETVEREGHVKNVYTPRTFGVASGVEERLQLHYFPFLEDPQLILGTVLERLKSTQGQYRLRYRFFPESEETSAGMLYFMENRQRPEQKMELLEYRIADSGQGLMALHFAYQQKGRDSQYVRTLLQQKSVYYERAFKEMAWPEIQYPESNIGPLDENLQELPYTGQSGETVGGLREKSLSIGFPGGPTVLVDQPFLEQQPLHPIPPAFSFTAPGDLTNLYIDYQSESIPEYIRMTRVTDEGEWMENLRFLPYTIHGDSLEEIATSFGDELEHHYLGGWENVTLDLPFLTNVGPHRGIVTLAAFESAEGQTLLARFTLVLPETGDLAVLLYSQVNPTVSLIQRKVDLETGGIFSPVAHSFRYIAASSLPDGDN